MLAARRREAIGQPARPRRRVRRSGPRGWIRRPAARLSDDTERPRRAQGPECERLGPSSTRRRARDDAPGAASPPSARSTSPAMLRPFDHGRSDVLRVWPLPVVRLSDGRASVFRRVRRGRLLRTSSFHRPETTGMCLARPTCARAPDAERSMSRPRRSPSRRAEREAEWSASDPSPLCLGRTGVVRARIAYVWLACGARWRSPAHDGGGQQALTSSRSSRPAHSGADARLASPSLRPPPYRACVYWTYYTGSSGSLGRRRRRFRSLVVPLERRYSARIDPDLVDELVEEDDVASPLDMRAARHRV